MNTAVEIFILNAFILPGLSQKQTAPHLTTGLLFICNLSAGALRAFLNAFACFPPLYCIDAEPTRGYVAKLTAIDL